MKKSKIAVLVLSLGLLMGGISNVQTANNNLNFDKSVLKLNEETETVYKTVLFGAAYNSEKVGGYTDSWSTTYEGFTCDIVNANNNNNGWNLIKIGHKNSASVGTITTATPIDKVVTSVDITIDAVTTAKINSLELRVSSTPDFASFNSCPITIKAGPQSVVISDEYKGVNKYYRIVADCQKGTSNGLITISKITFNVSKSDSNPVEEIKKEETKAQLQYTFNTVNHSVTQAFVEVTENLEDWSGKYLIGYKNATDVNIFKGKLDATHLDDTFNNVKNLETKLVDSNKIYYTDNLALNAVTIEKSTLTANKYTIRTAGGDYIGNDTGSNGLQSSKTITTDFESTIEYNTTTKFVDIKIGTLSFKFNNNADQKRFRFLTTSSNISLFKLTDLATPEDAYKYTFSNMKMNFGAIIKKSILDEVSAKATITEYGIAVAQKSKIDADPEVTSITEALSASEAKGYVTKKSQTYNLETLTLTDATGTADTGDYVIFSANLKYPEGTTKYTDVVDAVAYFVVDGSYVVLKEKSCSVSSLADEYVASDAFSSFTVYAQESLMALGALND